MHLKRLREYLGESLWFVPILLLLAFVALALASAYADRALVDAPDAFSLYGGSAESGRAILSTIATAMLSLAVLVFTITLVVLQLASSQLTPRVIPLFLQDRSSKIAMGVFLGTFAYALVGLWFVRVPAASGTEVVPVTTVSVALAAVGLSLLIFLNYVHRVAQSIRMEVVVSEIARQVLDSIGPDTGFEEGVPGRDSSHVEVTGRTVRASRGRPVVSVAAPRSGLVIGIATDACATWALEHDSYVQVLVPIGEYVTEGMPLVSVTGPPEDAEFPLLDIVSLSSQRIVTLDPAYGLRELVDIAIRALSPGVNEPGMAVIVLDRIHEILHRVGCSSIIGAVCADSEREPRVVVPRLNWAGWVALGLREVLDYGGESVQICARVKHLLGELMLSLPQHRQDVLLGYMDEVRGLPGSDRPYLEWTGIAHRHGD